MSKKNVQHPDCSCEGPDDDTFGCAVHRHFGVDEPVGLSKELEDLRQRSSLFRAPPLRTAEPVLLPLTGPLPGLMLPVGETTLQLEPLCTFRPKRFVVRAPLKGPALGQLFVTEIRIGNLYVYGSRATFEGFHAPDMLPEEEELGLPLSRLHRNETLMMPTMEPLRTDQGLRASGTLGSIRIRNVGPRSVRLVLDVEGIGLRTWKEEEG